MELIWISSIQHIKPLKLDHFFKLHLTLISFLVFSCLIVIAFLPVGYMLLHCMVDFNFNNYLLKCLASSKSIAVYSWSRKLIEHIFVG
jgi:hypothetical protein